MEAAQRWKNSEMPAEQVLADYVESLKKSDAFVAEEN
jgi:hypothetical protein